jgi:integrase
MRRRLTKRVVEALKPGVVAWDTGLAGFGVRARMRKAGGVARVYLVKYGTGQRGRSRWLTIGEHGGPWVIDGRPVTLTVDLARIEALRLLGEKARGADPASKRDRDRRISTVDALAARYVDEFVLPFKKPRTAGEYQRLLKKQILPPLGRLRLDQIQPADIATLHHGLRRTPREANHALAVIGSMFGWAETIGLRPRGSNPVRGLPRFRETKRERFLSPAELARLAKALRGAEKSQPIAVAAVRLLLFTGARVSEILTLRRDNVNLQAGTARLADSKTGAKTIQLNAPAREVLASLPKIAGNAYVLPGRRAGKHFVGLNHVWAGTPAKTGIRATALLPDVRLHDLRHSFASVAVSGGTSLPLIGGLLGHADQRTTARYAHLSANPLKAAAERIGERLTRAMAAGGRKT